MTIYRTINDVPNEFFKEVPVVIPTYNQLTYTKNTIERLQDFNLTNFIILDNGSEYPPFVKWIRESNYPVVVDGKNPGPRNFWVNPEIYNRLPEQFIVTDPDLAYPSDLPKTLVGDLIELSELHEWSKVALGLNTEPAVKLYGMVKDWEREHWRTILTYTTTGDPVYQAKTDTTFALYNKNFITRPYALDWNGDFFSSPRVCGKYLCDHLGWYLERNIPEDEYRFYVQNASKSISSTLAQTHRN